MSSAPPGNGPVVLRMLLGGQLKRLRDAAGVERKEAGERIRGSESKISRIERGRVGLKDRDVADLLTLYGLSDGEEREALLDLARRARKAGWWQRFGDVLPAWFQNYVGMEDAAEQIRTYELQFVPGLLQTEDYARAVISSQPGVFPGEVERRVKVRLERQQILERAQPPTVWAVLDETVLRRPVGGTDVLRAQLEHLREIAGRRNVRLQVVPLEHGGHSAESGAFTVLRFGEPRLPDVVYIEQLTTALYLDKPEDVEHYNQVMTQLSVQASEAAGKIDELLKEL